LHRKKMLIIFGILNYSRMYHLSHDQTPKKETKDSTPVLSAIALALILGAGVFFIVKLVSLIASAILH